MAKISFKLGGKDFEGALNSRAIEVIEKQFDSVSVNKLMVEKQSFTVFKAVISASVQMASGASASEEATKLIYDEMDNGGGLEALGEIALNLLKASGLVGKEAAKGALGEG